MKIILAGAGISGLTLHHFLCKNLPDSQVKTVEAYPRNAASIGGGLGLAPNGLYVLRLISPEVEQRILRESYPCDAYELRNSRGQKLGLATAGTRERYKHTAGSVMASRAAIYGAVRDFVESESMGTIVYGKRIVKVTENEKDENVEVEYEDGEKEVADILIGADGIKSVARSAVCGDKVDAIYEGTSGIGGFVPASIIPESERNRTGPNSSATIMTFGPDGFFGYCPSDSEPSESGGRYMWWSTFDATTPPSRDMLISDVKSELLNRHGDWKTPTGETVIKTIIETAVTAEQKRPEESKQTILILPNYRMPKIDSYGSKSGRVILIGDAAHVMPPHSGQGVSMAVEDAYTLATLLTFYENRFSHQIRLVCKRSVDDFDKLRKARVDRILDEAARQGGAKAKLTPWQEWVRDWMIWIMCKILPASMFDYKYGYKVDSVVDQYLAKVR